MALSTTSVSNPYKFKVYRNSAASTGSGADAKLVFDTEDFDTNNNFATGTYTAPVSGFYFFHAGAHSTTGTYMIISIYKNGASYHVGNQISTAGGVQVTALMQLSATNTVEIYTQANGAATLDVGSTRKCYFGGFLVSQT